jgi:hypothetical protein
MARGLAWLGRLVCWLTGLGDEPIGPSARVMYIIYIYVYVYIYACMYIYMCVYICICVCGMLISVAEMFECLKCASIHEPLLMTFSIIVTTFLS